MVRVNRNELSQKELAPLLRRFDATLAKLDSRGTTLLLDELLGKEERLTFAKRLAAIVLIIEGYSEYKTSRLLKLSPTTTGIVAQKIKAGGYTRTISLLRKKKSDYLTLLETIDSILHLGGFLKHRTGLDRYRNLGMLDNKP
jgi:hypothetical protein